MSLIHEALKRVETHKAPVDLPSPTGPPDPSAQPPPAQPGMMPPLWANQTAPAIPPLVPSPPLGRGWRILFSKSPIAMVLAMAVTIGATLMAMSVVRREMGPLPTTPVANRAQPGARATTPPKQPAKATMPSKDAVKATAAPPMIVPQAASQAPASAPVTPPLLPVASPPPPGEDNRIAPVRRVAQPPAAAARFKVNGIMSGPTGGAALINGRMIYVGQDIDGARLVATTANTVELEMEGVRFTLGINP